MAILAAGVGFAIRGGIFADWGREYGFSGAELGRIGGAGFTGFCFGIIIGGVIADKIGYGKLVTAAFLFHVLSAVVTFGASKGMDKATAYQLLFWGMFLFAIANGTLEAVANPLVATLFPKNRTHYLNILHASWPAGLVLGGVCGWVLGEQYKVAWQYQLALYLVPTIVYGIMFFGQTMPKSEASKQGLSIGEMFKDVGILGGLVVCFLLALFFADTLKPILTGLMVPAQGEKEAIELASSRAASASQWIGYLIGFALLFVIAFITKFSLGSLLLFVLFVTHALVGAVELGTDGWIQNITGNILSTPEGRILFVFTSAVMFLLRFCADFIEKKLGLSPVALLLGCAALACVGLLLTAQITSFVFALVALGIYAVGKTFFWPTMLAVASDRFPRTGAVAISIMGGIGMMSAGLIGSAGLGYAKDRFSGEELQSKNPALMAEYKSTEASKFLFFPEATGLDGKKLGDVQKKLSDAQEQLAKAGTTDPKAALEKLTTDERTVIDASIMGDRKTLIADAAIPATMAAIYLCLLLYFGAIGGYKVLNIDGTAKEKSH
ncbi:MAG: MFS transporter [Planctomycetia bacterium]|nr:MFS transporter [Planctomycetia bacterium]